MTTLCTVTAKIATQTTDVLVAGSEKPGARNLFRVFGNNHPEAD
jgi:glycerol-3-phosphate acyltransferase PlsY